MNDYLEIIDSEQLKNYFEKVPTISFEEFIERISKDAIISH